MKKSLEEILELNRRLRSLLDQQGKFFGESASSLAEFFRILSSETRDPRVHRQAAGLRDFRRQFEVFSGAARKEVLEPLQKHVSAFDDLLVDAHLARLFIGLAEEEPSTLQAFCEGVVRRLAETLQADGGFLFFCFPETSEAQIVAALNFESLNLSLAEYSFSRTLLRDIIHQGKPLLLTDAAGDERYGREASISRLDLKSVLGIPLKDGNRVIGGLYLENRKIPFAFQDTDVRLAERVAQFTTRYLAAAQMLPLAFQKGSFSFLDGSRISTSMVGGSPKMVELFDMVRRVADSSATVLIEGESGTGKELVAQSLHYLSTRRDAPLVVINCAAIPEHLLESHLFGHERGSFTSATHRHIGLMEQAHTGTVFLDEINELDQGLQAKLLRFIENGDFYRVGGEKKIKVDVRIVAASSWDLSELVARKEFHPGLYYRLNLILLRIPPLRERPEDIPLLVAHFLRKYSEMYGRRVEPEPGLIAYLRSFSFPGNVRQLEHVVHRLVLLCREGTLQISDLPPEILRIAPARLDLSAPAAESLQRPLKSIAELRARRGQAAKLLAEAELELYDRTIAEAGGNISLASRNLGIGRVLFYKAYDRAARRAGKPGKTIPKPKTDGKLNEDETGV